MRPIGIRAFRDNATKYLAGHEALEIQRHGHTVGFFIPQREADGRPPLALLATLLDRAIDDSDLAQDELIALLAAARSAR